MSKEKNLKNFVDSFLMKGNRESSKKFNMESLNLINYSVNMCLSCPSRMVLTIDVKLLNRPR
jgi:hypothetical protein